MRVSGCMREVEPAPAVPVRVREASWPPAWGSKPCLPSGWCFHSGMQCTLYSNHCAACSSYTKIQPWFHQSQNHFSSSHLEFQGCSFANFRYTVFFLFVYFILLQSWCSHHDPCRTDLKRDINQQADSSFCFHTVTLCPYIANWNISIFERNFSV